MMASSKAYCQFVLEQLSSLQDITSQPMMGEFLIYYRGKVIGGIYDDRFLVKQVPASQKVLSSAEIPYPGAKPMLLVDFVDDAEQLTALITEMELQLPEPGNKKKR